MNIYEITEPTAKRIPIVLSVPHCGTCFPDDLILQYKKDGLPADDTDWFVDKLYSFAAEMGIVVISAVYSRWVIDLNRNPDSSPLYTDGRVITGLCSTSNFLGEPIYADGRSVVAQEEVERRKGLYFDPYHQKIQDLLDDIKADFGQVLLWDCHSIRRSVPAIQAEPFPDLILGSVDGTSAAPELIQHAIKTLSSETWNLSHNTPFKGGYITRHFGKPEENQHALQMEMCKDLYMDDTETLYDEDRAHQMQQLLKNCLTNMNQVLRNLN